MSKIKTNNKVNNLLKVPSSVTCPKCGEKYLYYISNEGKKGILLGEYIYEGFFNTHYGKSYDCFTCNYHWEERIDKKSLLIRLFPFLENK